MAFPVAMLNYFVIINFSLPDNTDDYANRQLFLVNYILCTGVLPSGDKICDNKNNSIINYRHCKVSDLFFFFTSSILHTFGCNFFTQCLELLSTAEDNLKKPTTTTTVLQWKRLNS